MTEHWRKLQVGDCCELLGILKEEYDTQHAEIERLRARVKVLEDEEEAPRWARELIEKLRATAVLAGREAERHISRLQVRIAELESHAAITMGTLAQPTPVEPVTITHGHTPNAPPHDE